MLLLSTSSLKGYGLHKIFSLVKQSQFDGIDLVIDDKNYDTLTPEYIKSLSQEFKLPVLSITAPDRGLNKDKIDLIVKMAELLDTQVINFYPPNIIDKNVEWYLKYLNNIKKETRKSIAIQNVEQKFVLFVIPEYRNSSLMELKKLTGDTALNVANLDKNAGIDLIKLQSVLGNTVKNVYLSDRNGLKDGLIPGTAGGGISYLPIESFLMKLKTISYDGFFSLRVKPNMIGAGNDEQVLFNLDQVKKYLDKHFINYKPE